MKGYFLHHNFPTYTLGTPSKFDTMGFKAAIITLSTIAITTLIPPSVYHIKAKNVPAFMLIMWLLVMNIKNLVDACIWSDEDFDSAFNGHVYCDIMIKLQVGANTGITTCVAAIMFNLYRILRADSVIPEYNSFKRIITEFLITSLTPIMVMSLNYLVQSRRYLILRYSGCQTSLALSWVSVILYTLWMVVWSLISSILAIMIIFVFFRKRKDVNDILRCTNSGLTVVRFAKLLTFCVIMILVMFPVSLYAFADDLSQISDSYSFSEIHSPVFWNTILFVPYTSPAYFSWIYIALAYVVFIFFGLGSDSVKMYITFLSKIGFNPVIEYVRNKRQNIRLLRADKMVSGALGTAFDLNTSDDSTAFDVEMQKIIGETGDGKSPTSTAVSNAFSDRFKLPYNEHLYGLSDLNSEFEENDEDLGKLKEDDIDYIRMLCNHVRVSTIERTETSKSKDTLVKTPDTVTSNEFGPF